MKVSKEILKQYRDLVIKKRELELEISKIEAELGRLMIGAGVETEEDFYEFLEEYNKYIKTLK